MRSSFRARARSRCDDVTFGYAEGRPVVRELTLELIPASTSRSSGATGAGKSTVAKLLTRQYDPQEGAIELGGVDLRDATLESLHRRIVLLPQEGHLFSGTIADNVRLAHPEATDDEVRSALRRIGALERFEASAGRTRDGRADARRAPVRRRASARRASRESRWLIRR